MVVYIFTYNLHSKSIQTYYFWFLLTKPSLVVHVVTMLSPLVCCTKQKNVHLFKCLCPEYRISEHLGLLLRMRRRKVAEVLLWLQEVMEPCCCGHQLWSCLLGEWRGAQFCGIFIWTRSSVLCLIKGLICKHPTHHVRKNADSDFKQVISQNWRGPTTLPRALNSFHLGSGTGTPFCNCDLSYEKNESFFEDTLSL